MEIKDTCVIKEDKKTKKVACHKFKSSELNRELAVHEDVDSKNKTSVTDVKTGLRLFGISEPVKNVTEAKVRDGLENFIRHYTLDIIKSKFEEIENKDKCQN